MGIAEGGDRITPDSSEHPMPGSHVDRHCEIEKGSKGRKEKGIAC
jgi:hypothetical protein